MARPSILKTSVYTKWEFINSYTSYKIGLSPYNLKTTTYGDPNYGTSPPAGGSPLGEYPLLESTQSCSPRYHSHGLDLQCGSPPIHFSNTLSSRICGHSILSTPSNTTSNRCHQGPPSPDLCITSSSLFPCLHRPNPHCMRWPHPGSSYRSVPPHPTLSCSLILYSLCHINLPTTGSHVCIYKPQNLY
jgi:hypothetical protein